MKQCTAKGVSVWVGLDVSDRTARGCELSTWRNSMTKYGLPLTPKGLDARFADRGRLRIALEVGGQSPWVAEYLEALGHEVLIANPRALPLIYASKNKSDDLDAERLARLCRSEPELLSPITHRSRECRADLAVLRGRVALVNARTGLINHVRGVVKSFGRRLPSSAARCFVAKTQESLPEDLQPALSPLLDAIDKLTQKIVEADERIEQLSERKYPQTRVLKQIKGVGPLTALTFLLVLENPRRFRKSRMVGPYLGLVPRRSSSGTRDPELGITKAGDPLLRVLLVQCAHHILGRFGTDSDLRRWGESIAARGAKGAKKRAVVAVARKLAVLLHRLWLTGEVYEPLYNQKKTEAEATASAMAAIK